MEKSSENQKHQQTKQQPAAKQPYEPPRAIFVPLKLEEKLLACNKTTYAACKDEGAMS